MPPDDPAAAPAAPATPAPAAPPAGVSIPATPSAPAPAPADLPPAAQAAPTAVPPAAEPGADSPAPPAGGGNLAEEPPPQPVDVPGLLSAGTEDKATEAPETKPAAAPEPVAAAPPPAAPPEPLSYAEHPLTWPEGVTVDDKRVGEYDAILGQHRIPHEARQALAELYAGDVQAMLEKVRRDQYEVFARTREGWVNECRADPEYGGAAIDTHVAAAVRMVRLFLPTDEERAQWDTAGRVTGWADHPVMFRFLNRVAAAFAEPARTPTNIAPAPPQTGQIPRSLRAVYAAGRQRRNQE